MRPEKEILGQQGDKGSRRGSQWTVKGKKKERVYAGVENKEGTASLQNTNETDL